MRDDGSIDLNLLYSLLSIPDDEPLWLLTRAARRERWNLPPLIVSLLERSGVRLGSGAADELRRARRRHEIYTRIASNIQSTVPARIVKGPSIARRYPAGLVRPVGDLDVVVSSEETLWNAVDVVLGEHPSAEVNVTLFGYPDRHMLVTLSWPADDPILERELNVEICTAAFTGNREAVGIRPALPENQFLADLLSIAEERFQRAFGNKDFIDVLVLGSADPPPIEEIVAAADSYLLAPELAELVDLAGSHVELGGLRGLPAQLGAAAERERRRRVTWAPAPTAQYEDWLSVALATGNSVGGLPLRRRSHRSGRQCSFIDRFPEGAILRAPIGDFLLTTEAVVARSLYDTAIARLTQMGLNEGNL